LSRPFSRRGENLYASSRFFPGLTPLCFYTARGATLLSLLCKRPPQKLVAAKFCPPSASQNYIVPPPRVRGRPIGCKHQQRLVPNSGFSYTHSCTKFPIPPNPVLTVSHTQGQPHVLKFYRANAKPLFVSPKTPFAN